MSDFTNAILEIMAFNYFIKVISPIIPYLLLPFYLILFLPISFCLTAIWNFLTKPDSDDKI